MGDGGGDHRVPVQRQHVLYTYVSALLVGFTVTARLLPRLLLPH